MATELARLENAPLAQDEWTDARVDLVKRTYCKGVSDDEFELFIEVCKRTGLSPLARQIYAIMRKSDGKPQMTIQVGIDGFRLIADRTGRYVPGREVSYTYDDKGKVATATAYVKKLVAGEWHEVAATVRWEEFAAGGNFWNSMPHHQLGKVAEVHALRRAFPADLSGIYSPEEMDQADRPRPIRVDEATGEILDPPAALPPAAKAPPDPVKLRLRQEWTVLAARSHAAGVDIEEYRPKAGMPTEGIEALLKVARQIVEDAEAEKEQAAEAAA